jgi:hypothetical protein
MLLVLIVPILSKELEEKEDSLMKVILVLRDPRQHIIALLRDLKKPINSENIEWGIKNFPLMLTMETNDDSFLKYQDINECYDNYLKWAFEKLVGPKGGGTSKEQLEEIRNVMQFLGKQLSDRQVMHIASTLFGGTLHSKKVK